MIELITLAYKARALAVIASSISVKPPSLQEHTQASTLPIKMYYMYMEQAQVHNHPLLYPWYFKGTSSFPSSFTITD